MSLGSFNQAVWQLLTKLAAPLKGGAVDEIKENTMRQMFQKEDFADCFEKFKGRRDKCVGPEGRRLCRKF